MKKNQGQILVGALIITGLLVIITGAVIGFSTNNYRSAGIGFKRTYGLSLAEAGLEEGIRQLQQNPNWTGESLNYGDGETQITVTNIDSSHKLITSQATYQGQVKKTRVKMNINTASVSFTYAVQVDQGGLTMKNNSQINGSIYSNGSITGSNGAKITGDAYVAGGTASTANQQWTVQNSDFVFGRANPEIDAAQSFIPSTTTVLNKVSFYLKKLGSPPNRTVRLLTDNAGSPSKTELASGSLNAATVTNQYGWVEVAFTTPPNLTAGTRYWLLIDTSADSSNYFIWGKDATDGYPGGTGKSTQNWNAGNPVWSSVGGDLDFQVWMGGVTTALSDVIVGGHSHANTISNTQICGDAYYQVIDASSTSFLDNPTNPPCDNPLSAGVSHPNSTDPAVQTMPISQGQINQWKTDAQAGGVIVGDWTPPGNSASLGPTKITGNLTLDNNQTLTLTGTVWVQGNINISNGSAVNLDSGYGSLSGLILTDGSINLANNGVFSGSGQSGSYIMMLSTATGDAITILNNVASTIFYASAGTIKLSNNVSVKEATGYRLELDNNAVITYESGLAGANFTSSPGATWQIQTGTWQEIR